MRGFQPIDGDRLEMEMMERLALLYGWKGTGPDGMALAETLERAMGDIPDHDATRDAPLCAEHWEALSPLEFFSRVGKDRVRHFIEFLRWRKEE